MKLKLLLFIISILSFSAHAQWENLNTGINDNLNGVVFFQQNGIISGENGLYYTTNGGVGSSSWTELHIPSNPISAVFEDTKFTHCYGLKSNTSDTGYVYASGQTVSDSKAVLFRISIPSMTCELLYQGAPNTKLNKIDCKDYSDNLVAVGNGGKIIRFENTYLYEMVPITTEDLLSVSYWNFGQIVFGSAAKLWKSAMSATTMYDYTSTQSTAVSGKDVWNVGFATYSVGGNKVNYLDFSSTTTPVSNTNFSTPLDANSTLIYNGYSYVGTDHGIYKYAGGGSGFQSGSIEWQPSSFNFKINEFWSQNSGTYLYACGDNGVVVRTQNGGGATIPYIVMNANGTCINGSVQFTALTGSGNSANWFIDNALVSTSLTGFTRSFNTAGQYLVRLEVRNSFNEMTSVSQYINIVNIPTINKPLTLSDNILCKAESIQITIENSEPNVKYVLRKQGESNSNYGESISGNGGAIVFNSALIQITGNYYIDAVSTIANCSRRFDADFLITVEETKADFHSGNINAYTSEPINYYNQSYDAQNFAWQFTSNAGVQTSNSVNPQNSYAVSGQVSVNLDAWSNNNCHDVLTENGPYILDPISSPADCFLLMNNGTDAIDDDNYGTENISQVTTVNGGLLTCGAYTDMIFDSKYGVSLSKENSQGGFLTKHDHNGVLKWAVYTVNASHLSTNSSGFTSCIEDLEGNIYLSGHLEGGTFYDNAGNAVELTAFTPDLYRLKDFIIKLNSKGELIWRIQTPYMDFYKLSVDKLNNLVAYTHYPYYPAVRMYFNGAFVQNVDFDYPYGWSGAYDQRDVRGLIKITSSGTILWNTRFISDNTTGFLNHVIGFDDLNNIYVSSPISSRVDFYSANTNNNVRSVLGDGTYSGKFALAKYDSNGNCLWAIRSRTLGTAVGTSDGTNLGGHFVDGAGNIYVSGKNGCIPTSGNYTHVFENADGSTTETTKGTFFLAKVNTHGVCEWIKSTASRALASGNLLTRDADELFVLGSITSGNSNPISAAEFEGGLNSNYTLTMNRYNFFVATYDFNGNLKKIFLNSDYNNSSLTNTTGIRNFVSDQNGNFYLSRNMFRTAGYNEFGYIMPAATGRDGTVTKFKESCGVMMYDSTLSLEDSMVSESNIKVYPNPTSGNFSVDLKEEYQEILLEVYDIYGKKVKGEKYFNQNKLQSAISCSSGIYFLKLSYNNNVQWVKLIKN